MKKISGNFFAIVFVLYITISTFVFVPYFNWNYAKTHGFVKWILLGEIVATAKAVAWPYYVFFSPTSKHYDSPNDNHFRNSKKAYDEALIIVNEAGGITELSPDQKANFADLLRIAITEAKEVESSYLKEAHPDYPNMYETKYIYGMEKMLQGIETDSKAMILSGAYKCNEFSDWIKEHKIEFTLK